MNTKKFLAFILILLTSPLMAFAERTNDLPPQAGQAGKFLQTDGLNTLWSIVNTTGALNYLGTWDASTNTPTLTSGGAGNGDYYVVSVAGTTNLDGITDWGVNDFVLSNGSSWQKIDNSEGVFPITDLVSPYSGGNTNGLIFKNSSGNVQNDGRLIYDPTANKIFLKNSAGDAGFSNGNSILEGSKAVSGEMGTVIRNVTGSTTANTAYSAFRNDSTSSTNFAKFGLYSSAFNSGTENWLGTGAASGAFMKTDLENVGIGTSNVNGNFALNVGGLQSGQTRMSYTTATGTMEMKNMQRALFTLANTSSINIPFSTVITSTATGHGNPFVFNSVSDTGSGGYGLSGIAIGNTYSHTPAANITAGTRNYYSNTALLNINSGISVTGSNTTGNRMVTSISNSGTYGQSGSIIGLSNSVSIFGIGNYGSALKVVGSFWPGFTPPTNAGTNYRYISHFITTGSTNSPAYLSQTSGRSWGVVNEYRNNYVGGLTVSPTTANVDVPTNLQRAPMYIASAEQKAITYIDQTTPSYTASTETDNIILASNTDTVTPLVISLGNANPELVELGVIFTIYKNDTTASTIRVVTDGLSNEIFGPSIGPNTSVSQVLLTTQFQGGKFIRAINPSNGQAGWLYMPNAF